MKGYAILIEKGKTGFGASVPDLPGCYAIAKTRRAVLKLIREAMVLHIEGLRADGEPVPEPVTGCKVVEV
jgi:predicted RNase H-like HicB family nuclease